MKIQVFFEHYSSESMPFFIKKHIADVMCHPNGGMIKALEYQLPFHITLIYKDLDLIGWAHYDKSYYEKNGFPYLGAWIDKRQRRKGYGEKVVQCLLDTLRFHRNRKINVYHKKMERMLIRLGYKPVFLTYDQDELDTWLHENYADNYIKMT